MTEMQRTKGQRGEREFCALLSEFLGNKIQRQLGAARDGGTDVLLGNQWAIEIKRGKELRRGEWWRQACRQAADQYRFPALAYRIDRQQWQIVVPLDVLMFGRVRWENTACSDLTATLSIAGFAALVRETMDLVLLKSEKSNDSHNI